MEGRLKRVRVAACRFVPYIDQWRPRPTGESIMIPTIPRHCSSTRPHLLDSSKSSFAQPTLDSMILLSPSFQEMRGFGNAWDRPDSHCPITPTCRREIEQAVVSWQVRAHARIPCSHQPTTMFPAHGPRCFCTIASGACNAALPAAD